jgi:TM2 domain-containing membrane protein YozV
VMPSNDPQQQQPPPHAPNMPPPPGVGPAPGGWTPPPPTGFGPGAPQAAVPYQYGFGPVDASKKVPAGICGILLGALGVHKFILGYTTEGLVMLLVTVLTCGFGGLVTGTIGLIEGIIYLTKSDEEFHRTYVAAKKGWF